MMKRERSATALALMTGIALALCAGATLHYTAWSASRGRLSAARRQLEQLQADNAATARTCQDQAPLRRALQGFAQQVPEEVDLGALLQVPELADANAPVAEREITTRAAVAGPYLSRTPVCLRFKGSFTQLLAVLRGLEGSERAVRLDRVVAETSAAARAGGGQVSALGGGKPLQVEIEFSTFSSTSKELSQWATAAE